MFAMGAQSREGPSPSKVFSRRLAVERRRLGWTAQRLSDETKRLGMTISRSTIAKIESGARGEKGVTIDEAAVLAVALDVPLPLLFLPIDTGGTVALTPTTIVDGWRAFEWMAQDLPLPGTRPEPGVGNWQLTAWLSWSEAHASADSALSAAKAAEFDGDADAVRKAKGQLRAALRQLRRAIDGLKHAGVPDRTHKDFHEMMKEAGIQ
jgi:transcriptional regulator with XRE-family HTH domain